MKRLFLYSALSLWLGANLTGCASQGDESRNQSYSNQQIRSTAVEVVRTTDEN